MKKAVFSILMSFLTLASFSQVWNQVGSGLSQTSNYHPVPFELGSSMGVAYTNSVNGNTTLYVEAWNGVNWSNYPTYTSSNFGYVYGAGALGGMPYVVFQGDLLVFNGTSWSTVTLPSTGTIYNLIKVGNELLLRGNFTNGDWGYLFDGTTFTVLPTPSIVSTSVEDALYYNNDLYIVGSLDSNSTTGPLDVLKLDNGVWVNPVNWIANGAVSPSSSYTKEIMEFQGGLYVLSYDKIFELSNDTAIIKGNTSVNFHSAVVYNNAIYMSNGASTGGVDMTRFDGTATATINQAPRALNLVPFQGELYGFSYIASYNGVNYNHAYRTQAGFSYVSGNVFNDLNADCTLDVNESGVPAMAVKFSTGDVATTNFNGAYSIGLAPGAYTIDSVYPIDQLSSNVSVNCPLPISVSLATNSTVTQNVGATLAQGEDVSVYLLSPWRVRYGFVEYYNVVVSNLGQAVGAGTLDVTIPASVNIAGTSAGATQVGTTISWAVSAMSSFEQKMFSFQLEIDTNTNSIGDTLVLTASLSGYGNDVDLSNNSDPVLQEVRGAYDPNDKQVNIELAEPGSLTLDYYIRFQNTGNDTAYKVTVVDTLSGDLNASTFMMLGATHEYEVMLENNTASFVFENILLPDSSVSQEKSQGGLRFRINTAQALTYGESVSNDAYIYFDFQQPIHTNYAITEVKASVSLIEQRLKTLTLEVFPNPAKSIINLKSTSNQREDVRLMDISGRIIKQISLPAKGNTTLDVSVIKSGIYFVTTNTETYKILIKR